MAGPMSGVRIIDLSMMATGPLATSLLADQGADVIKVEPPGLGDALRGYPSYSKGGLSALIIGCNRGKRSLAVDLDLPRGVEVVRRLVADADVFVQNFRPGVIERMGLAPDVLRSTNSGLITVSVTGFGRDGPMAGRPVYDPVIQAITGHVALQVNPEIPFPDLIRHVVVDKSTAMYTAQAITAALFERAGRGRGQHIDLSMVDASLSFLWPDGMMTETLLDDDVTEGPTLAELYQLTNCTDGQLIYFTGTRAQWIGLLRAVGRPEWCDDERYNAQARVIQDADVRELVGSVIVDALSAMTVDEAIDALVTNDVPCGRVTALADVPSHPQVVANDSLVEFDHPVAGRVRQPRPAARFSETPNDPNWIAPMVGEHSDEVLAEAGWQAAEIANLREAGVIH